MNRKAINGKLNQVFDNYLKSIADSNVRDMVKKGTIISGGAITSMLCNEEVNDYDLYFKDKETALTVIQYYADLFNKAAGNKTNKDGFNPGVIVIDGEKFRTEYLSKFMPKEKASELIYDDELATLTVGNKLLKAENPAYSNWQLPMLYKITPPGRVRVYISSRGILNASEIAETYDSIPDERVVEDQSDVHGRVEDIFVESKAVDEVENLSIADSTKMVEKVLGKDIKKYFPAFFSSNAITLKGKIQLIIRFYGKPDKIHENFDFVHCTNYWSSHNRKLVLNELALESILTKQLYFNNSVFPVSTLFRIRKFMRRGFNISAGEVFKIAYKVSKLNLDDTATLEEQLVGVDSAYFSSFIFEIRKVKAAGNNVDETVVGKLIDKIFV